MADGTQRGVAGRLRAFRTWHATVLAAIALTPTPERGDTNAVDDAD